VGFFFLWSFEMIATSLGSFVVNLGSVSNIPPGEERVFQVGGQLISIVHTPDANVLAVAPALGQKTYPAMISETGDILVGIEGLWRTR
jgi:hypothetical protein